MRETLLFSICVHQCLSAANGFFMHYQISFRPNWIWREVVEVFVITPAVGENAGGCAGEDYCVGSSEVGSVQDVGE